jgi:hypothetical protein
VRGNVKRDRTKLEFEMKKILILLFVLYSLVVYGQEINPIIILLKNLK